MEALTDIKGLSRYVKYYISGPMTGKPNHNHHNFNRTARFLINNGYSIHNPAENDGGSTDKAWEFYIRRDLKELMDCDGVILLQDWQQSRGANLEVYNARALGMPIFEWDMSKDWDNPTVREVDFKTSHDFHPYGNKKCESTQSNKPYKTLFEEALEIVRGARNKTYGKAGDDFARTAARWTTLFHKKLKEDQSIESYEVGLAMMDVKLSRLSNGIHKDSLLDIAGYLLCVEDILREQGKL